jgi:hypothetical protein
VSAAGAAAAHVSTNTATQKAEVKRMKAYWAARKAKKGR